ncbi:hypothetical protein D3C72_1122990 [compost metagenome]
MLGLDDHADAVRAQHVLDGVGDVRGHLFLNLQAPRKAAHHAGQLGDADHAIGRQVADVGHADDRQHVVFAEADEADVLQHDQFVVAADLLEGLLQIFARLDLIALEQLAIGLGHPLGRFHQTFAVGIVARPLDQGADGGFGFGLRDGGFVRVVGHSVSI